jgi:hypothetical protein
MTALHVSRRDAPQLTSEELTAVTKSIQQFQLGEGSKGQRLLDRGKAFGNKVNDPCFVGALELFIKEEQQHSEYLAHFMQSQNISLISHWVDTVFRKLHYWLDWNCRSQFWLRPSLCFFPYYRALREMTHFDAAKYLHQNS